MDLGKLNIGPVSLPTPAATGIASAVGLVAGVLLSSRGNPGSAARTIGHWAIALGVVGGAASITAGLIASGGKPRGSSGASDAHTGATSTTDTAPSPSPSPSPTTAPATHHAPATTAKPASTTTAPAADEATTTAPPVEEPTTTATPEETTTTSADTTPPLTTPAEVDPDSTSTTEAPTTTSTTPPTTSTTTTPPTTSTTTPPKSSAPLPEWGTGQIARMKYEIRAYKPIYDGGTVTAKPTAYSNPATNVGTSFEDAIDAARELASDTAKFRGITVSGSAAVLQAEDGTYYVTRLKEMGPDKVEGSPPVDGEAKKAFLHKAFRDLVKSFEITEGVKGLRAIVGKDGYYPVDDAGKGGAYVEVED